MEEIEIVTLAARYCPYCGSFKTKKEVKYEGRRFYQCIKCKRVYNITQRVVVKA